MLTEYSSYDEMRKFRNKAVLRSWEIMREEHTQRLLKLKKIEWSLRKPELRHPVEKRFETDGQKVEFLIYPKENEDGTIDPLSFNTSLSVSIQTRKGVSVFQLHPKIICVLTPHYISRSKDRLIYLNGVQQSERHPYMRNGRQYELLTVGDNVLVCRRPEPDILIYITHLTKDMCTSRNFQGIFAQAGKDIDEHDIYVWK